MMRTRGKWSRSVHSVAGGLSTLIGVVMVLSLAEFNPLLKGDPSKEKSKQNSVAVSESELASDFEEAIRSLERGDVKTFLERYAPVEGLRRLRQQDNFERAVRILRGQPKTKQQLIAVITALKNQKPTFDKSRGLATFQYDLAGHGVEEVAGELHLPITDDLKLAGLGGDLKRVTEEATRLLADGEFASFVDQLFPASELARLKDPDAMQDLLQQFQIAADAAKNEQEAKKRQTPRKRRAAQPQQNQNPLSFLQSLQADFHQMQTLTPELMNDGTLAVFQMESNGEPNGRVIKFQKIGADWRLFDDAERIAAELTRQSQLKPGSSIATVQMEQIGGNWRFVELPGLHLDGK